MSGCCNHDCALDRLRERQRGTLRIVLAINALMFFVIAAAALYGKSSALLSDSLDNLGDALTYGLSLYAVARSPAVKARVALFKGGLIFLSACAVAAQIVFKLLVPVVPAFEVMGVFSLAGLAANSLCLFLLWRHRGDDVNMSSVWECSRNDIASNLSVFVAAGGVWLTGAGWPDIAVASCLVLLLMRSAFGVIRSAWAQLGNEQPIASPMAIPSTAKMEMVGADPRTALVASTWIHRKILVRLFWGWLCLSAIVGSVVLFLEIKRMEDFVHQLALQESAVFSGESAHNLENLDSGAFEHLTHLARQLVGQHFLIVELYDRMQQLKLEAVRSGSEFPENTIDIYRHNFPKEREFSHQLHFIDGQLLLIVLVPLEDARRTLIGYFEGVYQVDQTTLAGIEQQITRSLAFVALSISTTTLLMYPIVLILNRWLIGLAKRLLQGNLELMTVLGSAIAQRDSDTNEHNYRVTYYALRFGESIGLSAENLRHLIAGAFLHDVGKIGIRDPVLLKPGKLTPEEYRTMQTHVLLGVEILKRSSWLQSARDIVEFHHEKYDGSGYVHGLKGEAIPLHARLFAIVDVFDALTSERPYKKSMTVTDAIRFLEQNSGSHFDPHLLDLFKKIAPDLHKQIHRLNEQQIEALLHRMMAGYFLGEPHQASTRKHEVIAW
jgi:putative nucleotidyltransferase with HDIG domain